MQKFNMLKKLLVRKPQSHEWMVMVGYDSKIIKKSELNAHLKNGWELVENRYFVYSDLKDRYKKQNDSNKIAIISLTITSIISIIFGIISII